MLHLFIDAGVKKYIALYFSCIYASYYLIASDPCSPNPCLNGGSCFQNDNNIFFCNCPEGFTGDTCQQGMILL